MRRLLAGMAITTIVALSACWVHADDQQIAQQIVQKLRHEKAEGHLVGFGIDLEVDSGIVWLKGHVGSRQQHKLVLDIARHTSGVEQVVNDLQVNTTTAAKTPSAGRPTLAAKSNPNRKIRVKKPNRPTPVEPNRTAKQESVAKPTLLQVAAKSKLLKKPTVLLSNLNKSVKRAFTMKPHEAKPAQEIGSSLAKFASVSISKEKPVAKRPVAKKPVARKPVARKPVARKPVAKKPVAKKAAPRPTANVAKATAARQPTGRTDASIAEQIIDRLRAQKSQGNLRNFDVDVQVNQGVVWVSGRVASADQQKLVLDISRRAQGVKQVVNDLRVSHAAPTMVASVPLTAPAVAPRVAAAPVPRRKPTPVVAVPVSIPTSQPAPVVTPAPAPVSNQAPPRVVAPAPFVQQMAPPRAMVVRPTVPVPMAYAQARSVQYNNVAPGQQMMAAPRPMPEVRGAAGVARARYDHPTMPGYAWPSYAAHPNYGAVTYPKQYSPTAWPYIGPFYPYPQVPLGWRKVTLEWDDGWWMLDFKSR